MWANCLLFSLPECRARVDPRGHRNLVRSRTASGTLAEWRAEHPDRPTTLTAGLTFHSGVGVHEQAWSDLLTLGPIELGGLMVEKDNGVGAKILGGEHLATWGMAALRRVRMIVDGPRRVAYVKPLHGPAPIPEHNRLGAVFVPDEAEEDGWIAHVAKGSPAYEAGLRTGDVLLRYGAHDFSGWRASPIEGSMSPPARQPPGTKVELTVRRGVEEFRATVVLRDILKPTKSAELPESE